MSIWIYIIVLAVVQGIAEFLPISSSGHLALIGSLFGLKEDENLTLGILLHAGSLLAIVIFYFKTLLGFFTREQLHLGFMVIAGTIPAAVGGLLFKHYQLDEKLFGSEMVIGFGFLITATVLRMSEKSKLVVRPAGERDLPPTELKKITLRQAILIGCAQFVAIIPGISRSGSTITAGILTGVNREAAGTFSFLLAIPAIAGATLLELLNLLKADTSERTMTTLQLSVGLLLSAAVSYLALALLVKVIRRGRLSWFSWYLYVIGAAVVGWQIYLTIKR